jgi:hypothetical protein
MALHANFFFFFKPWAETHDNNWVEIRIRINIILIIIIIVIIK